MNPATIASATIRYIKLGPGGAWADRAIEAGEVHLGHREVPHDLAMTGDRTAIIAKLMALGRTPGKASDFAREIIDFYKLPQDSIWITFHAGQLWWAQAAPQVTWLGDGIGHGARSRPTLAPWRNTDLKGRALAFHTLSTRLTKVAAYRQTLCAVEAAGYLRRKLAGDDDPLVKQALTARAEAVAAAEAIIGGLHQDDFETLVDMLLARVGWFRMSRLGGTMKDADLVVEQPIGNELAMVQVKSAATQAVLNDYIARFDSNRTFTRLIFACHDAKSRLDVGCRSDITLWDRSALGRACIGAGLLDWLIERAG